MCLIQDEDGNLQLERTPKLEPHTHPCDVARVIKWKMMEEMHSDFFQDLTVMPSKVRKKKEGISEVSCEVHGRP